MNQSELQNLKRLHSEATQGEWKAEYWYEEHADLWPHRNRIVTEEEDVVNSGSCEYNADYGVYRMQDAELICAMHKHLPYLLEAAQMKMEFDELGIEVKKMPNIEQSIEHLDTFSPKDE